MSKKTKVTEIISAMNAAPSGTIVSLKDYIGSDGTVKTFQAQLGVSYEKLKAKAIAKLREAVEAENFEPITVTGKVWANADGSFATRKSKDRTLVNFYETYDKNQVLEFAKEILEKWENPDERKSNKVQLTDKPDALSFNSETGNFNLSLLVFREYYKEDLTAQEKAGRPVEIKASHPDTVVKKKIREMFDVKYKAFTFANDKFASFSIDSQVFLSENITL